jgi:hypothetical protein
MTPEDQQRLQQQNAAIQKAQSDAQVEQLKHQNDLSLVNEKGTVQAGVSIIRQLAKSHADEASAALERMQGAGQ